MLCRYIASGLSEKKCILNEKFIIIYFGEEHVLKQVGRFSGHHGAIKS